MLASPKSTGSNQRCYIGSASTLHGDGVISSGKLSELESEVFGMDEFLKVVSTLANHYQVPYSFIALNAPEGMSLKARIGISQKLVPHPSMCHHGVDRDLPIIIEDVRKCERVKEDTLVMGPPHARFFAESPLIVQRKGELGSTYVGSICILDSSPRAFSLNEINALCSAADEVSRLYSSLSEYASKPVWEFTMGSLPRLHDAEHFDETRGSVPGNAAALADDGLPPLLEQATTTMPDLHLRSETALSRSSSEGLLETDCDYEMPLPGRSHTSDPGRCGRRVTFGWSDHSAGDRQNRQGGDDHCSGFGMNLGMQGRSFTNLANQPLCNEYLQADGWEKHVAACKPDESHGGKQAMTSHHDMRSLHWGTKAAPAQIEITFTSSST